ncbi:hypothetical protein BH11ARM1_BH11ARM1_09000 [soil metagenome]
MPPVTPTVWTNSRKWLGNLLPAIFSFPFLAFGLFSMMRTGEAAGSGLIWLLIGTAGGWIAVNFLGLFPDRQMKRELKRILEAKQIRVLDAPFVGIATPKFSSTLDPHEDVGFLQFHPEHLSFDSETRHIELSRKRISKVGFKMNVHTLVGLGRWINLEGEVDGKTIRLLVEPRERRTLLGNLIYSKRLAQRIRRWSSEAKH